ncbi:MAG: hypothetical protein OXC65_05300 [Thiotrichales bacterium]|nr:hypothetical protein [Thiotrichales bacterium]
MLDSMEMEVILDRHLYDHHPLMRLRLSQAGQLAEFRNLRVKQAKALQRDLMQGVPKNDRNKRRMVDEIVLHQLLDLPNPTEP